MLHLRTLGELRLEDADGRVLLQRRKPLVLLAYLARRSPRAVSRAELAALAWGEREEARARQSLRQALLELKRHLGGALDVAPDAVALSAGAVTLDLQELERDDAEGRDRDALDRWHGEFLSTAQDGAESALASWIDVERAGLRRRLGAVFERLVDRAERRADWREAIALAARWCDAAPLDERAAMRLVGSLRHAGRHRDALAAHAGFVARLRDALEVRPSEPFMALAGLIERDASHEPPDAQVPAVALPLLAREDVFSALTAAWRRAQSGATVVALIKGAAGMGASRLCAELAHWVRDAGGGARVFHADLHTASLASGGASLGAARVLFASLARASALAGVAPASLSALRALLPDLAQRFPHVGAAAPDDRHLPEALREALTLLAEDAPVLVLADGLARADAASRALVHSLGAIRGARLMLVVADRSADLDDDPALGALREDPSVVRVTLTPLSRSQVTSLVRDEAVAARLWEDTGGIPSLLAAHIETLLDAGVASPRTSGTMVVSPVADGRPFPTPPAARAIVRDAGRHLDDAGRAALDAIAVFGAPIALEDAATLAGVPLADAERAVAELERRGVARGAAAVVHGVELAPPVLARAAYDLVPVLRREAMHAACASLLTTRPRHDYDRARVPLHLERAGATQAPRRRSRWRRPTTAAAAAMILIAIAAAVLLRPRRAAELRPRTVAVFPFAVRGDAGLTFLQAGMVSMLSTSLDGAAGLRTLDPRTVLAAIADSTRALSPQAAREAAARLGAAYFVLGDAVGNGGRLQVRATLYDARDATSLASATAEGAEPDLFALVDRLGAELAVSQGAIGRGPAMQLGALTTSSLDALKAYLDGEALYRANDMPAALAAFQRATAADSSFSLAWYGMASAASWMLLSRTERQAAEQAVRTSGRLSERDRDLVLAFAAFSRGDADSAEQLASSIAEQYDDVEAWVILGETLYHHNWKRGRSLTESRRAFEHVLTLDPRHWPAIQHLSEVAAIEGKRDEADSLLRRYRELVGAEHMLPASRAFEAFAFGGPRARDSVIAHMRDDRGFWLISSVWYVAIFARDLDGAHALAAVLVDPVRPPEEQGLGRILLAHLDFAQGKWHDARAELAIAAAHAPLEAVEHEAILSLAPFLPEPPDARGARRGLRDRLRAAPLPTGPAPPWPPPDQPLHPMLRAYVSGMLSARDGDAAGVAAALRTIDSLPDPTGPVAMAEGFRYSIRAELARAHHTPGLALELLDKGERETPWVPAWTSAFVSQAYERFVRAELLHESGRDEEALLWYGTFAENSPYDLAYLGPALYRQGEILERLGRPAAAVERYARFVDLWKHCDAELRPLSDDASRRLARLRAAEPR